MTLATQHTEPVAVVGMACRVSGADDAQEWWRHLLAGERRIRPVPHNRLAGLADGAPEIDRPHAAVLDDLEGFDADFFGLSRRMSAWTDPQQRILLELSWHALESAGIAPESLRGKPVAVFAATWVSEYRERMLREGLIDSTAAIGTLPTFLANRLSFHYGLTGPSMSIDTACSAGLTAFALAVRGIQHGDYAMALVGAVNVLCAGFLSATGYKSGLLSRSGKSVPFAAEADGYIRGEGGACVVLKRLSQALADDDPIIGVVRGVAMNHDGAGGGLTGPDASSHTRLIDEAIRCAGVAPESIGYLEAHGPGTSTGDPVEVRGLRGVIGDHERMAGPEGKLWIGSAKGNVGHLEAAAGLIGVVKALLTLRNSRITAIPELTAVNPDIDFDGAPIAVADHAIDWPSGKDPRRAAVSAFGLGGSNAHAVLEEAPIRPATGFDGWRCAVPLSARTAEALRAVAQRLHDFLVEHPDWSPASVAWTSQSGRAHHDVRVVVTASTREELLAGLTAAAARRPIAANSTDAARNGVVQRYEAGEDVDWTAWWPAGERPIRVDLPGYPFTRTKHWFSKTPPTQEDD